MVMVQLVFSTVLLLSSLTTIYQPIETTYTEHIAVSYNFLSLLLVSFTLIYHTLRIYLHCLFNLKMHHTVTVQLAYILH